MKNNIETDRVRNNTSEKINAKIDERTFLSLNHYSRLDKDKLTQKIFCLTKEWDIERWLETNASVIAFVGVLLGFFVSQYWLILPALVLIFLFQHAIQGWCPPIPIMRRFNIRTQKEIDVEIYALKFLRGDFDSLNPTSNAEKILTAVNIECKK